MENVSIYSESYFVSLEDTILGNSICGNPVAVLSLGNHIYPGVRATDIGDNSYTFRPLEEDETAAEWIAYMHTIIVMLLQQLRLGDWDRLICTDWQFNYIRRDIENKVDDGD